MNSEMICWCGNTELQDFSPGYKRCGKCGTLVCSQILGEDQLEVSGDETGFYSRDYWFDYQVNKLNQPTLPERSRSDLSERVIYWLRTVLNYQLPPAKCLELGCGHGGFVALLRQLEFDAMGLELSPWVVDYAKDVFKIPMLLGPIEQQQIDDSSIDLIILMDVLEHLPDPNVTLRNCINLLKPDGKLIIQSPEYKINKNYANLKGEKSPFLKMLLPGEHIFLFSRDSVKKLLFDLGFIYVEFQEAYFPYDMFFIASRNPLQKNPIDQIDHFLLSSANGRVMLALLDLDAKYMEIKQRLSEVESDRKARFQNIKQLEKLLNESEIDRAARLVSINDLEKLLAESENDRAARLESIQKLEKLLEESEIDRAARLRSINKLETLLEESERDRVDRLAAIQKLEENLNIYRRNLADKVEKTESLEVELKSLEARFRAKVNEINEQKSFVSRYSYQVASLEQELSSFPQNLIIRIRNKISPRLNRFTNRAKSKNHRKPKRLRKIVVDLTPVVPGGGNGGAKLLATMLVWQFSRNVAPDCDYILLTSDDSHGELSWLDSENVNRLCVNWRMKELGASPLLTELESTTDQSDNLPETREVHQKGFKKSLIHLIGKTLEKYLPTKIYFKIYQFYRFKISHQSTENLIASLKPDLIFCPFTAPFYYSPGIPIVIVVHDLQYLAYPQFFSAEDINQTDFHFRQSCKVADRLICVSEHTRQRVIEEGEISPERVITIHTSQYNSLRKISIEECHEVLRTYQLLENRFLLYPANFWPHKNHEMLLTAFSMFKKAYPESDLKLVFTGAPGDRMEFLTQAVAKMFLKDWVILAGFVDEITLSAFFQTCRSLIFPSLYEGFGVPVLEAMSFGVPVLCSNLTSLPEIGQDAVEYFDPRKPDEIVAAIARMDQDDEFRDELIKKGKKRVKEFQDPTQWAKAYFDEFRSIVSEDRNFTNRISGVFTDQWVSSELEITIMPGEDKRFLEICLEVPSWLTKGFLFGRVLINGRKSKSIQLPRGQRKIIRIPIDERSSKVDFLFSPTIQPKEIGIGDDVRSLSCRMIFCNLLSPNSMITLYNGEIE